MNVIKTVKGNMSYDIYSADERAKCPVCGKTTEMFYMQGKRKYINPVTQKESFTYKDFALEDFAGDLDELYKKYTGEQT